MEVKVPGEEEEFVDEDLEKVKEKVGTKDKDKDRKGVKNPVVDKILIQGDDFDDDFGMKAPWKGILWDADFAC